MKITPLDLRKHSFKKSVRGYDPEEIREFLELVATEFEYLIKENTGLTERVRGLDEKVEDYRNMEKALNDALISAQRATEKSKENAKKEAELILKDAEVKAEKILERARIRALELRTEIAELEHRKQIFITRFRSMLKEQLQSLSFDEVTGNVSEVSEEAREFNGHQSNVQMKTKEEINSKPEIEVVTERPKSSIKTTSQSTVANGQLKIFESKG